MKPGERESEGVWEKLLAQPVPRVVAIVAADDDRAVDGIVGPTLYFGRFPPFKDQLKSGDVWVEERPTWTNPIGIAHVWDGAEMFGIANVHFPQDGRSRRTVIAIDDGHLWKQGLLKPQPAAELGGLLLHPAGLVRGSREEAWSCPACGAESWDKELFWGVGCTTR